MIASQSIYAVIYAISPTPLSRRRRLFPSLLRSVQHTPAGQMVFSPFHLRFQIAGMEGRGGERERQKMGRDSETGRGERQPRNILQKKEKVVSYGGGFRTSGSRCRRKMSPHCRNTSDHHGAGNNKGTACCTYNAAMVWRGGGREDKRRCV